MHGGNGLQNYNRRTIAQSAMYRVKQLFGDSLTLRDYDGKIAKAMTMAHMLNRMTQAYLNRSKLPENLVSFRTTQF